jgi:hypothetical protein
MTAKGNDGNRHSKRYSTPQWPGGNGVGMDAAVSHRPMYAPPVRIDSGIVCEACGMHVDTTAACRCSA